MKVAAIQLGLVRGDQEKAIAAAETQVRTAASKGAKLVCLPEHWLLTTILRSEDPVLNHFVGLAEELKIHLNLGANFQRRGTMVHLSSHTISPKGEVLSTQDKLHLYRREKKIASPGKTLQPVQIDGVTAGVLVCHDLVFPEPARTLTLMGAELLIVPALIEADGRSPWLAYLRARALENRVPIISPNCFSRPRFLGSAAVISLDYSGRRHIMHLGEKYARSGTDMVIADLDLNASRGPRAERLSELRESRSIETLYRASRRTPASES